MAEIFFSYVPADRPVVDRFGPTVVVPGDKASLRLWQPGGEGRIADWLERTTGHVYCIVSNAYLDLGGRDATVTALGDLCLIAPDRVTLVLTDPTFAGLWGSRVNIIVLPSVETDEYAERIVAASVRLEPDEPRGRTLYQAAVPEELGVGELLALRRRAPALTASRSSDPVTLELGPRTQATVRSSPAPATEDGPLPSAMESDWGYRPEAPFARPSPAQPGPSLRDGGPQRSMRSAPPAAEQMRNGRLLWIIGTVVAVGVLALLAGVGHVFGAVAQAAIAPAAAPRARAGDDEGDMVEASAYAPEGGRPGEEVLVQVLLHQPPANMAARAMAAESDPAALRRGVATLCATVIRGQKITVLLEGRDLDVDDGAQTIVWRGEPAGVQFLVTLPDHGEPRTNLRVRIMVDDIPYGAIRFSLALGMRPVKPDVAMRGEGAHAYRRAFLSYATADRVEVLKRAQGLRAAGLDFFQDVLSLEPGQQWEAQLLHEIDNCDLFLLFWSSNAAKSEWVGREIERAVARRRQLNDSGPDITPVIIEGPPPARPIPAELRDLHFNDYLTFAIAAGTPLTPPHH